MRKNFAFLLFAGVCFCWMESCQKKDNPVQSDLFIKTGKKLDVTTREIQRPDSRLAPLCGSHGGQIGIGTSWDIATCRSGCTSGIGFRCGRETYAVCKDGAHQILQQNLGGCFGGGVITYHYDRQMKAAIDLFDNGTAKIIFQKTMVADERANLDFELEGSPDIELPENIVIGGEYYRYLRFIPSTYQIDYADGAYGSVAVRVQYIR